MSTPQPRRLAERTVVVGSGKGGVGKSTITVNLGVALARYGLRVGIVDADIYGPSLPAMLGLRRLSPPTCGEGDNETLLPFTKFGVKALSIGNFVEEARAVVWRGPMIHGALTQMLGEVSWGELDVMLIDLPPGTGDVVISLSQVTAVDGAVAVTTPQEVAMLDAIKAINALDMVNIPLIGVVENMAGFTDPTGHTHHLFGQGKGAELASRFNVPLLGSIPIIPDICVGGDEGRPAAFHEAKGEGGPFAKLVEAFLQALSSTYQELSCP